MKDALAEAELAFFAGEVPVGAIVVKDDTIISRAHNFVERDGLATAHAELRAIDIASKSLGRRLNGCTLITTLEPCPMCMGAILNARIDVIVFGAFDPIMGCACSAIDLSCFNKNLKVVGGVLIDDCESLLKKRFGEMRN